ncbi:MAG TPA: CCA tRNA nucleotidyltransferase [Smithellaceae bacterium]|mgnify:CR=1 FL=1|nr:CCA tRNA nucleotidyltransferase [Smithellaceae bacterium]HRS89923.1 CCA tRNA nucleotidyltransferase [Smithellaceae bacterium]HRV26760.1 CCA tRNA nucleotidyltransferase [Smithellaceae bacterium]
MPDTLKSVADEKLSTAKKIVEKLKSAGFEAYFVGGCVRDFVRGVKPVDYDIATSALPEQVTQIFKKTVEYGAKFGVIAVVQDGNTFEVATFRRDDIYEDGRRPKKIHYSDAREDVLRRDFTVNGLLMDPETGEVIDYVGGRADIEKKIIRTIGDPLIRFSEDYLRMLRAVRFAANLNFTIENKTFSIIRENSHKIKIISAERIQDELTKIITRQGARRGMELMKETGLLSHLLPEIEKLEKVEQPPRFHPEGDVWQHTLIMLELLSPEKNGNFNPALAWAALLHDAGKADTKTEDAKGVHFYGHVKRGEELADNIMKRLRFSRVQLEIIKELIHYHMVFMNVQKMRPGRLKRFLRMPNFDLHLELHRLDCLASHGMLDNYEFCVQQLKKLAIEDLHPQRLITGDDLIALGYEPGKMMGRILKKLENEQLEGKIKTKDEALTFVEENWRK